MPEQDLNTQPDNILRGGDVNVLSVDLYSSHHKDPFKLDNIWQNISIFENINLNYIEGQITISETQDLFAFIPIIMNEKIVIKFITPSLSEPYTFVGHIHEVPSRVQVNQGQQVYVLGFVSPELVRNQKAQFAKSYNNLLISDMVKDIHAQYIEPVANKPIVIVPTSKQTSRVVPTMSPFKAINWLAKWATAPAYRSGVSYVFFENRFGYYFGPVEGLVDKGIHKIPAAVYTKDVVHAQEEVSKNILRGVYSMSQIIPTTPKHMPAIVFGGYGSKTKVHDIVLRTITTTPYNYFDKYPTQIHLENADENSMLHNDTSLGEYTDSHIHYISDHYFSYPGQPSYRTAETALTRASQLHHFFAKQLNIVVPGDSDRTIGEVVNVLIPSASPNLEGQIGDSDKYLSGRYLITKLRHSIDRSKDTNKPKHHLSMVLSSDSYRTPLPDQTIRHWR